jgi:signal transduction histidine kinase
LKSGEVPQGVYAQLWSTIMAGGEWRGEFHDKRKNGELYWEYASISSIKNTQGVITHYIKVAEDIGERKQMEKMKDEFVSMVSHELRTPLTAIKECIAIVLEGAAGPVNDEQKDFLATGKRNVDRLSRLINDVLDFQKLQAGRLELHAKECDLNALVQEVQQFMQPVAAARSLLLQLQLAQELPLVMLDRDKIIQVLSNLINNAVKFTEKGSVTVTTARHSENAVMVSVADTGTGIRLEDFDKLFKSFSQVGPADARKTGSTGLGLAISREIVQKHGGKIWVESEYGKGSTFRFILPIVERRVR